MTKQDWLDYFEAVNGRSASPEEVAQALAAGEFQEEAGQAPAQDAAAAQDQAAPTEPAQAQANPEQPFGQAQPQFQQSADPAAGQNPFNPGQPNQAAYADSSVSQTAQQPFGQPTNQPVNQQPQNFYNQANPGQQFNQTGYQEAAPGQQPFQGQSQQQQQFSGQPQQFGQQAYYQQPAQPNQFTQTMRGFWSWLLSAWKAPTSEVETKSSNGYIALGLLSFLGGTSLYLSLFSTMSAVSSSLTYGLYSGPGFDFRSFFMSILSAALVLFSVILGGFTVKRLVYRDDTFTFNKAFDWYGRLFAIVLPVVALATVMNLLRVLILGFFLNVFSVILVFVGATFALAFSKSRSNLDPFYKYLLAILVNGVIVLIFSFISSAMLGSF